MNTFPIMLGTLCVFALAYRYYSAFIAAKVLVLDDRRTTPAHTYEDGHNYVPSPKWVLFGHHFAAIAGAGPLVGPTLAAQFGFAPGFLWILIGAVLAGCVHDFTVLVASVRHKGKSLADVARTEIGHGAGLVTMIALAVHPAGDAGRPRRGGGQRAGQQSVGRVHHRMDDSHRDRHGPVHVQEHSRPDQDRRAQRCGSGSADRRRHRRPLVCRLGLRRSTHLQRAPDHLPDGGLRIHRLGAAGVVPARTSRLSLHLHEAGNDRAPDSRRLHRSPQHSVPGGDASSSTAADRLSKASSSRSCLSPSPVAQFPDSTRWCRPARRPRCCGRKRTRGSSATEP